MEKRHFRSVIPFLLTLAILLTAGYAAAEKSILLTFTGDCTIGCTEKTRADSDSFESVAKAKGYDYFFANYREMFEQDDLTVINFEGVLSDKKAQESQTKTYRFRAPTEFVKVLTGSSIEICSLANNHTGDFGAQGEESTKAALEANQIGWFKQYTPYIYEKDGIKIAFVSLHNIWNEFEKVKQMLLKLKEEDKVNSIVVCWHAGLEYRGSHETNVERTSQAMVKYGADLVIINHPHVIQGINITNNRSVFYSLGNFVFGGNSRIRTEKFRMDLTVSSLYSIVVQARMTFSDEGKYLGQQIIIYPTCNSSGGYDKYNVQINNFQPYRANMEEAEIIRKAIQLDTTFDLPEVSIGADGLSRIDLGYLAAFDGVEIPEGENNGPMGVPEASNPTPTRQSKGN